MRSVIHDGIFRFLFILRSIFSRLGKFLISSSGKEVSDSVERAISIFDEIAIDASDEIRDLMLDAFYKSTVLEWHFWNDSYNQVVFDAFV